MSYYDHAVMITYRLGPWANAGRDDHREYRCPPRRKPFSALIRLIGRAFHTLRNTRIRLVQVNRHPQPETGAGAGAGAGGSVCESHHKGLSAG